MKLQHRGWLLVLTIVCLSAFAAMVGVRYQVESSFERLASERSEREASRARRLLDLQLTRMSATAKDYAWWVDAVEYTEGQKEPFLEDNFDITTLGNLQLSEVLIFDTQAQLLNSIAAQPDETLGRVSSGHATELLPFVAAVLADPSGMKTVQTYRVANGKLEMLVAVAIRNPEQPGDRPHGALLMTRYFDESELLRFSDLLMYPTRLAFDRPFSSSAPTQSVGVSAEQIDLYATVQDAQGNRVVDLVIGLDRDLEKVGKALAWQSMVFALGTGVLASVVLALLMDRLVLRRLQRLHSDVQGIVEQEPTARGTLVVGGQDELSELGHEINRLLDRVRADTLAQSAAHQRQETLQLQLMQSQKTEALGRFTSGIAHDFNNSLAAIGGWVHLAEEDTDPQHPSREALQQALKATRYAKSLVQQLLAFSRQSPPRLQLLQVGRLIEETRSLVSSGLLRQCELVSECPPQDIWVTADLTQMEQVLVNLVTNAVDAMGGKGTIRMVVQRLTLPCAEPASIWAGASALSAGDYVHIALQDQGVGISAENVPRVFDPFFTTKTVGKGTGLGLSVAQGIMARHDGAIGLTTEQGKGTTLHVYLPERPAPQETAAVAPLAPSLGVGRILFVDDEPAVRLVWTTLLTRRGWAVTPACDGEEAWALFQQDPQRWDVVLTDLAMPRLDGCGLTLQIQQAGHQLPIVLMSGHVGPNDALVVQPHRFAAVLQKPVDSEELFRVLAEVFAASRPIAPGQPDSQPTATGV